MSEMSLSNRYLTDQTLRTGASKVMPVVHIARRQPWEKVMEAEKELSDYSPVTAPAPNRSGEQTFAPSANYHTAD